MKHLARLIVAVMLWRGLVEPSPVPQSSLVEALEAYGSGAVVRLRVDDITAFYRALRSTAPAWTVAGTGAERQRRRNAVALLALEGALKAAAPDRMKVIEWACEFLRAGERSEFERRWMLASIAYAQRERLGDFLLHESCPATNDYRLCHLLHAINRYPEDRWFSAGKVFSRNELNVLTRRPVVSPSVLTRSGPVINFHPPAVSSASDAERIRDTVSSLEALVSDPELGPIAQVRLGVLYYQLRAFDDSRTALRRAITATPNSHLRYFAHLVMGLGFNSEGKSDSALTEFESAVAIDPGVFSGAIELAVRLLEAGRLTDASNVVSRALETDDSIDDPWVFPCPYCAGWSVRLGELRRAVRR